MPPRDIFENVKIVILESHDRTPDSRDPIAKASDLTSSARNTISVTGSIMASPQETMAIKNLVKTYLLSPSSQPYSTVKVAIKRLPNGTPQTLIAYMLRAYTYTLDMARIEVDGNLDKKSVTIIDDQNFDPADLLVGAPPFDPLTWRGEAGAEMVFGTSLDIQPAIDAVNFVCNLATNQGYRVVKLLGQAANRDNYQGYLTSHLKAFGCIQHGRVDTERSAQFQSADWPIDSSWVRAQLAGTFHPEVVYCHCCEIFCDPFIPAFVGGGVRTFISGTRLLQIGTSEEVFKYFWYETLRNRMPMGDALETQEETRYFVRGAHGISGDLGRF